MIDRIDVRDLVGKRIQSVHFEGIYLIIVFDDGERCMLDERYLYDADGNCFDTRKINFRP